MYRGLTISVVIPCHNEEQGIGHVVSNIPSIVDDIIVVDNASTDATARVARSLGAHVVYEARKGYGSAHKAGYQAATTDLIATADGDGTYPVKVLPQVVDYMVEQELDFVSCCRFPLLRRNSMCYRNFIGNMAITFATALLFHEKITDALSGMWVFRRRILPRLNLTSNGWNMSEEIKIEAILADGVAFGEYHIEYAERIGRTKLIPWRVGVENIAFLLYKRLRHGHKVAMPAMPETQPHIQA